MNLEKAGERLVSDTRLEKGTAIAATLAVALSLTLTGCQSNGNAASSASASASPSSEASASPSSSAAASPSAPSPSADPGASDGGGVTAPTTPTGSKPAAISLGTVSALRLADENIGWAGGKDGWVARTDDGGKHWTAQYSGKGEVRQLFALNKQEVWATLDTGSSKGVKLIGSKDGGKHWSAIGTVPNGGFLHFTNATTAFSGNAMTADGGKTWTTLKTPAKTLGDVYFHDKANGWAVQLADGKFSFLHSANGGQSWQTVWTRKSEVVPNGSVIRSAGKNDAWIELVGDSGMTQTSYSLFHTTDGGKNWLPAIVKNGAGSGPAPGFAMDEDKYPTGTGNSPGALYVVDPQTAIMGGQCQACDKPNSTTVTVDGGKHWVDGKQELGGYGSQYIGATDAKHLWLVTTDAAEPSAMYTSADGGKSWKLAHTFAKPKNEI